MAAPCYHHSGGRSQSHLRRIGSQGPASGVVDVIHFWKTVTLIGRKRDVVDYFLSCATPGGRNYMSRIHARVIWTSTYELVDSSLTGVYVNDVRIHGRVVLQEGDTVTFGHPDWQSITPRARARQPNSPFYFLFEHCHCSTDQMHSLHGKSPMRAAAGVSLEAELKAALPQRAQAAPRALPASLSLLDTHHGCCCAAAFPALPPPLTLAASAPSPGTSSPSEDSVSLTSSSAEMPDDPHLGASPCSALEGSVHPTSWIRRSLSPEYEEEMPALEMIHSPLIQEDPGMNGSEPMGGSQEPPAGCMPGSRRLFLHESCSGEAGTSHLHAVCLDHIHASLPTSTCPEDSVAADCGSSSSGTQVIPVELPEDVRQLARAVQTEEGGNLDSRLSPPGTKEQVSSGSDHSQEIIRMEMDESTEETAKSDTCSMAQPGVQMRAMELRKEAVSDGQVTSAGNSQDRRMGKEGTVEGHDELFIEMPLPEDALRETEREVDGSVTDRSLANGAENIAAETSDLLSASSGSRTPDGLLCGQEPGSVSPMRLVTAAEVGSRALTVALPCEIQSGHGAGAADTPENASDDGDDAETLPHINTRLLATDCPLGPRDSGSEGPAMESGTAEDTCFVEISRAEAGTQSGGMQARETRPATAEERGSSSILEVLQRCDSRFNTQRAKDTLRQQLPKASASDFPTQEGEFSEERVIIAVASSDSSSDSLLETCKEDQALAAAASPAGMDWGKEPHEADLPEQPMDLDGRHFGEHPSQRRETFTEGMQEESTGAVAAERELEDGGAGLARTDTCAGEAHLVASRLGCEEGRHERDGTACVPLAASPGAGEPDAPHGRESEGEEEVRHEGASGREGSQVPRGEGIARAFRVGAAVAEGGLENQPERSAGNLGGGATHSASSSAHGHAWLLPPFPSPSAALGEEGSPHSLCGICVGTGLSFQRSEQGAGGRLESGNSHLSPKQGDLKDEQGAALNDDMQAMAQGCAVGTEALAVAQWHREMTEPEKKDAQAARQADSTRPESREASPLPQDCQEPELHAGGPQGLEGGLAVKPPRADVEQESLPPEGDAWEEVCEPGVGVEYLTPPGPEGCREEVLVPEQGQGLQQGLGGSCCGGLESNISQGLCSARILQEGTARNLPRENQMGSAVAPESFSSEDLNLYMSNSEVKREENDNSQVCSNSGREAVIPKERDPLVSDSVEHLDGVNEGREGTEQCATCGQCEAASQETGGGPSEAVDMLQEQNASCPEPCCDENGAAVAVPQTSIPDMAFGEKSPSPAKAAVLQEELVDQAAEGTELGPLSLLHASEKDLCLLESDARLGGGEQAPGGRSGRAEEVGSALLEGGGTLDSRFADQPGLGTLETSETPEENLQSETPTSICAGGLEGVQKMEGKALLPLKEETEPLRSHDEESQREDGPGCSDRPASAACGRTPFVKEEAAEGCSARKRHSGGEQALGTPDSEKGSSSRKRRCLLDSGSGLQPSTQRLAAPLDLERRREQFDRTVGKFLQQYSSRTALPSEDAEGKNRDSIAQIVRTYFTSALGLEEPGAESLEAERSARPLEAGISEDADCKPAARAEPEKRAGSSPTLNEATSWDPSPRGACSAASPLSQSLGSHTQQPGREAMCHVPESVRKAYSSEEEEFQSSISSVIKHSPLNYPVAFPKATCVQESCGKNVDLVFSDISSSSVESEGSEPSPDPDSKSSTGIGRGRLWGGMLSEAAETGLALGGASCLPKPPDVGWCAEDRSASSGTCVSSHKSIQLPKGDFPVESGGHVDVVGDDAGAPVLQQAEGAFDGEGDHKAPGTGAPQVTSCFISSVGETREEPDHSPSEMHIEDAALLQRSHEDSPSQGEPWPREDRAAQSGRIGRGEGAESSLRRAWASSEQDVAFQLQECHSVLEEISQSLRAVEGIDDMHMKKWRDQIAELQKATKMPKTYIAVVGNTGAGKSSLLNALLDEEAVLPTSAMRACTAVVVEISRAAGGQPYEADVEFLSREEWLKELNALLEDMKDKSGNLKKRCPDRKTEAGAAYSRVKAVYGRVDKAAALEVQQDVTQHLGTVKHLSAETAADFRANIEKFIDSRTDNLRDMKGGEFWPIVKCVRIRVARAEVLKTGVVLVDLPGVRDSNAARDDAAKEYLKSCNAVWVVASITRAVDDKTAKEILNINLRRQLFMDGQFGNLAFICTKTDSFNITDIVRDLDLREEIQPLEEELEELEAQRMRVEEEKGTLHWALQPEQRQGVDATNPAWLQRQHDFLEKEFQMSSLQKQKDAKLRAISLVCVQARNRFSKQRIRMDFNTGLEELKKKAEFSECDNDGDEDMEDGDFASSDAGDLGEAESEHEKLHVFTVSSTEYLKLSGKLLRDGPPQVFHDPKDTEIPALKNFAIETGMKNSMKATEKVIRDVARVISETVNYLTSQRAEDISHQASVQEVVQQSLQDVPKLLQEAVDDVLPDIQYCFGVLIKTSLQKGSNIAKELCEDIVKSWGLPDTGFSHATYHAACVRHGVYSSPKSTCVDFNGRLAQPVYDTISTAWNEVFSSKVVESLSHFAKAVLDKLKTFFRDLQGKLRQQSSVTEALRALRLQQMEAFQARLCNFLLEQEEYIRARQRTISRLLTPSIQAGMAPAYVECSRMSGPGYFQRMKNKMESHVRNNKDSIFDSATGKLQRKLQKLQQNIQSSSQSLVRELNGSLRMQFEPLLKPVQRNARIIPELMSICAKVDKICKRSCVDYVLPSTPQVEAGSPEVEKAPQGDPPCFSALCLDLRLGAVPLPHVASIQVSGQDLALTLADETTVVLPLSSISLCESCRPLGCLILHIASESAREICRSCRVEASIPGQWGQEALVILDKARDQRMFSSLVARVSSSCRDASWFQALSLHQGRERLESLGVSCTVQQSTYDAEKLLDVPADPSWLPQVVTVVQQPQLIQVNLQPYGGKRVGEALQPVPEKRHKSRASAQEAGLGPGRQPPPSWSTEGKMAPYGQSAVPRHLPASRERVPENCRWNRGQLLGAAQLSMPASELTLMASPGSTGACTRAEEGKWWKRRDPDTKGDSEKPRAAE